MSVRRSLLLLTVLTLLVPVAVFAARANQLQNAAKQSNLQNLQLYRVQRGSVEITVSAIGTLEADQTVNLSFVTAGRVEQVFVQPGDVVQAGDALVKLVDEPQRLAYEQASLAVDRANLNMEQLLQPPSDDDLRVAQANVDSAWGAFMSLANAVTDQDMQAATLNYQQAYQAWQDADRLYGENPDNQTLRAKAGEASFKAEIARLQLDSLKNRRGPQLNAAYLRVVQAKRELDRIKAGPPQAQIDQANIAIQQAQAQLDRAATDYKQMTLIAPFDGVVANVNAEAGALLTPGLNVIELTDMSPLRLTVQVDEIDVRQLTPGMTARVELDALPGIQFPAALDTLALVGSNNSGVVSYDAHVLLNSADPRARIGMTAEATFLVEQRHDVLVVPNLYIRLDRQRNRAYVNLLQPDNTLREVEVKLGLRGQDSSEILSGLQLGDVVAVDLTGDKISILGG